MQRSVPLYICELLSDHASYCYVITFSVFFLPSSAPENKNAAGNASGGVLKQASLNPATKTLSRREFVPARV
ncbi:hypothetical protein [Oceanobacter kriegii]|uniref:hypothetical protein n=1 Tax=Oceanobacter kriegii TaxID=64972 RepID=UPI0012EC6442|nr:hypothetical protein [Oceanobacter kriegii]